VVAGVGKLRVCLIAPRPAPPVGAARRLLPFGLERQPLASPLTVCRRVAPGHVDDRVRVAIGLEEACVEAGWIGEMAPVALSLEAGLRDEGAESRVGDLRQVDVKVGQR